MPTETTFLATMKAELDRLLAAVDSAHDGVLVALSGGADSVALLRVAVAWRDDSGGTVEAAHLDHGLRGAASDADAAFCTELCERLDVKLHLRHADPRETGGNLEETARNLRRTFFAELLASRPHLAAWATGHHRNDQLETLIMRFFRGTGAEGLRGIRPVDGHTIHPLLSADRAEITSYLREIGQDWREDPTNADGSNTRSRVRCELLPMARDIFGAAVDSAPLRLSELLTADATVLEATARVLMEDMTTGGESSLAVTDLTDMPQPLASRIVRLHLRDRCGLSADLVRAHVDRLLDWLPESRSGAEIDLVGGWRARRDFDRLVFTSSNTDPGLAPNEDFRILVRPAGAIDTVTPEPEQGHELPPSGEWRLTLPADALHGEPRLRLWVAGDRLVPFGMDGRKKISDILREARVPSAERAKVLLVEDDEGPLWLVGLVRAERTRLLPSTTTAVTLLVRRESVQR
jgi:tRNA(Ile)-lysidine synthase